MHKNHNCHYYILITWCNNHHHYHCCHLRRMNQICCVLLPPTHCTWPWIIIVSTWQYIMKLTHQPLQHIWISTLHFSSSKLHLPPSNEPIFLWQLLCALPFLSKTLLNSSDVYDSHIFTNIAVTIATSSSKASLDRDSPP